MGGGGRCCCSLLLLQLFDLAERLFLVLPQVGVLRHDPLDQDRQHKSPLVFEPPQFVEGRVADLKETKRCSPTFDKLCRHVVVYTHARHRTRARTPPTAHTDPHLDEIFQRFDVLGLLLGVRAFLGLVSQGLLRNHLPHVRVPDGGHDICFAWLLEKSNLTFRIEPVVVSHWTRVLLRMRSIWLLLLWRRRRQVQFARDGRQVLRREDENRELCEAAVRGIRRQYLVVCHLGVVKVITLVTAAVIGGKVTSELLTYCSPQCSRR